MTRFERPAFHLWYTLIAAAAFCGQTALAGFYLTSTPVHPGTVAVIGAAWAMNLVIVIAFLTD